MVSLIFAMVIVTTLAALRLLRVGENDALLLTRVRACLLRAAQRTILVLNAVCRLSNTSAAAAAAAVATAASHCTTTVQNAVTTPIIIVIAVACASLRQGAQHTR